MPRPGSRPWSRAIGCSAHGFPARFLADSPLFVRIPEPPDRRAGVRSSPPMTRHVKMQHEPLKLEAIDRPMSRYMPGQRTGTKAYHPLLT